jgi:macrophage erythroblast attacher
LRERYRHLATVESDSVSEAEYGQWAEKRLDRWIVDWALRNGKEKTARMIAQHKGVEVRVSVRLHLGVINSRDQTLVDIDLFMDIRRVEDALGRQSCTDALAWCSENKTALRKIKVRIPRRAVRCGMIHPVQSTLEFELRLQEYIELCRMGRREDAIAYSKKHLVTWQETHLAQIRQALALLAFSPSTSCGPYKVKIFPRFRLQLSASYLPGYSAYTILHDGKLSSRPSDLPYTPSIPFPPSRSSTYPCMPVLPL